MEIFHVENLTFTYGGGDQPTLSDISTDIQEGEFVVLCGASGCGKTTLLRLLKPELSPFGKLSGEIRYRGSSLSELALNQSSAEIGFVMQNPDNQIVTDKVWHELAFGAENLGLQPEVIRRRVAEIAAYFGIQEWFHQDTAALSGGQKQILNLAAVMVCEPKVLLLDEPTGALDPVAASDFLQLLHKLNRELGVTVILAEHRLEEVLPMADRVLVMQEGALYYDVKPKSLAGVLSGGTWEQMLKRNLPAAAQVYLALGGKAESPLTVREGRAYLERHFTGNPASLALNAKTFEEAPALSLSHVGFRYARQAPDVLQDVTFSVYPKERFFIVGGNGAGKSTLLQLLAGIRKPYKGKIQKAQGRLSLLPQNPQLVFLHTTVQADYEEALRAGEIAREEWEARISEIAGYLGISQLLKRHPYDLSGGEQQRAALGKILLVRPHILLLDEPTKGLDGNARQELSALLKSLCDDGVTVLAVTHDLDFCAENADRCAMLADGEIVAIGQPREFFAGNRFYTTAANRLARGICNNAVTASELAAFISGEDV